MSKLTGLVEDLKHEADFSGQSVHDALCDLQERYEDYRCLSDDEFDALVELAEAA
jgi:hypothetical protein